MKIQDLFFVIILAVLLYKKNLKLIILSGILFLVLAIPLFGFWIFFTAQRLVYFAALFFLIAALFVLFKKE